MFAFGKLSRERLEGVQPRLVRLAECALSLSTIDFGIAEGLRSPERQAELQARKLSRTKDSFHLDGHAIDCFAYVQGKPVWTPAAAIEVAQAFWQASLQLGEPTTWGGVWDEELTELAPGLLQGEVDAYAQRWRNAHPQRWAAGERPLIDMPHFQIRRTA